MTESTHPPAPLVPPAATIVRAVPDSYPECLRTGSDPIDVSRARAQHAAYCAALRRTGAELVEVPAAPDLPDCCFVEDVAVVLGEVALLTRPGAPSRRAEPKGVAEVLGRFCRLLSMGPPGTLDGGDVLRWDAYLFVGRSQRSNDHGIDVLAQLARSQGLETVVVAVEAGLHLKSACSLVDGGALVFLEDVLDPTPFERAGLRCLGTREPAGANVLALGSSVLVSAAAPATAAMLRSRGAPVEVVAVDEFHKGDGALTCLSLRIPAAGHWST